MGSPFTFGGAIIAGLGGTAFMMAIMFVITLKSPSKKDMASLLIATVSVNAMELPLPAVLLANATMGVVFGLIYAALWHGGLGIPNWWVGGIYGCVHGILVILALLVPLYIRLPFMPGPSKARVTMGPLTMAGILLSHIGYGGVVGLIYAGFTLYNA